MSEAKYDGPPTPQCQHIPVLVTAIPHAGGGAARVRCERCRLSTPTIPAIGAYAKTAWVDWANLMVKESAAREADVARATLSREGVDEKARLWDAFWDGVKDERWLHIPTDVGAARARGGDYGRALDAIAEFQKFLPGTVTAQRLRMVLHPARKLATALKLALSSDSDGV